VLLFAVLLAVAACAFPDSFLARLSFLSRAETLLPLGLMVLGAIVGTRLLPKVTYHSVQNIVSVLLVLIAVGLITGII
jgi:hypothetical protein